MDAKREHRPPIGFPLLPTVRDGRLSHGDDLDRSVRESIRIILSTRPGELLMHPDFGAGLDLFLSEPDSAALRRRLRDAVSASLARWEDRIDVDAIDLEEVTGAPGELRLEIRYRLRRTGAPRALALVLDRRA